MTELRFDNRVAVITGAGRGLGRAYALLLAAKGAKVIVNDAGTSLEGEGFSARPAEQVAREIRMAGGEAFACTDSVATQQGGRAIIQAALDHFGRLDILVPNAGIVRYATMSEMSGADFEAVLDVHTRGTFHVVRPAFPLMCQAGYGRIVLISSITGLYGDHRLANYAVAKMGMLGLCNVVALEGAAAGVKCNVMAPGAITRMAGEFDTASFPKTMAPENVAPAVGWLCHESCSITGEVLASIAGRIAKIFLAETPGIYRENWTIDEVGRQIAAIRDARAAVAFPPVPSGVADHMQYSFEMAGASEPSSSC